jgi:hypothetical protein
MIPVPAMCSVKIVVTATVQVNANTNAPTAVTVFAKVRSWFGHARFRDGHCCTLPGRSSRECLATAACYHLSFGCGISFLFDNNRLRRAFQFRGSSALSSLRTRYASACRFHLLGDQSQPFAAFLGCLLRLCTAFGAGYNCFAASCSCVPMFFIADQASRRQRLLADVFLDAAQLPPPGLHAAHFSPLLPTPNPDALCIVRSCRFGVLQSMSLWPRTDPYPIIPSVHTERFSGL